jgi:hypothetical protein
LKNFGENRIQKYIAFHPEKIEKGSTGVKIKKNCFDTFLLTPEHSGLILFAPCLFSTLSPPPPLTSHVVRHFAICV